VVPFHEYMCPNYPRDGYLFPDGKGGHWSTNKQSRLMERETEIGIGVCIMTQSYRQLQVGFDREYVRTGLKRNDDNEDELESDGEDEAHDRMAVHSGKTGRNWYGRKGLRIPMEMVKGYGKVSDKWLDWIEMVNRPSRSQFVEEIVVPPAPIDKDTLIRNALCRLHGDGAKWTCEKQKEAVYTIMDGISPLVCIFPTGGGKTTLIMIPAMLDKDKTTIVVTPYIPLAEDLEKRCKSAKISCLRWTPGTVQRATIVVVVSDTGTSGEFQTYTRDLFKEGRLSRLYFDEAHTLLTEKHFRQKFELFRRLCLPVPWIFLTATFPPSIKCRFEEELLLMNPVPTYIRETTNRRNARYSVIKVGENEVMEKGMELASQAAKDLKKGEKILIFCRSVNEVKSIGESLKCCVYYSKSELKKASLEDWKKGENKIMVTTSALGAGMNISNVVMVIHLGKTFGCTSFVQESGRGGREGEAFKSVTMIDEMMYRRLEDMDYRLLTPEDAALTEFITIKGCRRKALSRYQDGAEHETDCMSLKAEPCDNCIAAKNVSTCQKRKLEFELEEQEKRRRFESYDRRRSQVVESVQEERLLIEYIKSLRIRLEKRCSICWAMNRDDESKSHSEDECELMIVLGLGAENVSFAKDSCCYNCGLPGDMCEDYVDRSCSRFNFVKGYVLVGVQQGKREVLESIKEVAGREFNMEGRGWSELLRWFGRSCRSLGFNGTNLFAVFCISLQKRGL
jgi:superfamily II DNA helicase RecQ